MSVEKRLLCWLPVFVAGIVACTPAAAPEGPRPPAPGGPPVVAPAEPEKPQPGGTLVYGTIMPTASLHPLRSTGVDILRHVGPAYETLLSFDYQPDRDYRNDFKVVPWLADSWEQPDNQTYIFRIRKGVRWHDGQEFTAADVARTFQWIQDEKFPPATTIGQMASWEAGDPYSLKVTLRKQSATFLEDLAGLTGSLTVIAPEHAIDGGVDFNKTVIGTGPFKLRSFESGKQSIWVKNTEYWQPGRPYPDDIHQFFGADDAIMTAAFITGKNDLLAVPDKRQLEAVLKQKPDAKFKFEVQDQGLVFSPRVDLPPFSDLRVRKAMHLAIDRQAMVQQITFGEGVFDPPLMPGWRTGWAIPQEELVKLPGYRQPKDQDLAEARRLLAEAGYPNGVKFKLMYNMGGVAPPRVSVVVEPMWMAVGLNVELEPVESAAFRRREAEGQFDVTIIATVNAQYNRLDSRYLSKGSLNRNGINDSRLDELINRFTTTLGQDERRRLGLEMQRYLLEQLYTIPTINIAAAAMWQPWVRDYVVVMAAAVLPSEAFASRLWLEQKLLPKDR